MVDALRQLFEAHGVVGNDKHRDLFCIREGRACVLFEVKTSTDPADVYSAVGQLMVHGTAHMERKSRRVLVLPGSPKGALEHALERLRLDFIAYDLAEGQVTFSRHERIVRWLRKH